jgi:DNA-binding beta-propeller fold protein YncE
MSGGTWMLQLQQSIPIPPHTPSEFDHGDVHHTSGHVFVAHTQASTVEVLDGLQGTHLATLPGCAEASGVLVAQEANLVFAAARGAGKVLVIDALHLTIQHTITVDPRPNGLAWDPVHQHLLVADVQANTARLVTPTGETLAVTALPGRPRWCVYDAPRDRFLVNIREPAWVQLLAAETAERLVQWPVASAGPHGLDLDPADNLALVASDEGHLISLDLFTGQERGRATLAGAPDAIWYNSKLRQVYVAISEPGVIDVVDIPTMQVIQTVPTEADAHTTAFDPVRQWLYVFLPAACRAEVFALQ